MCTFVCTLKVHIKSARAHVHICVHFESAHVHFKGAHVHIKGAHVHFHSAHVHFLCSKSNSTSSPNSVRKCVLLQKARQLMFAVVDFGLLVLRFN